MGKYNVIPPNQFQEIRLVESHVNRVFLLFRLVLYVQGNIHQQNSKIFLLITLSSDFASSLKSQFVCAYETSFNHTMQVKSINAQPDRTAESHLCSIKIRNLHIRIALNTSSKRFTLPMYEQFLPYSLWIFEQSITIHID